MKKTLFRMYNRLRAEYGPQGWWPVTRRGRKEPEYCGGPKTDAERFEVMVGAVLTQNTNWSNVEKAIANLKKENMLSLTEPRSREEVMKEAVLKAESFKK